MPQVPLPAGLSCPLAELAAAACAEQSIRRTCRHHATDLLLSSCYPGCVDSMDRACHDAYVTWRSQCRHVEKPVAGRHVEQILVLCVMISKVQVQAQNDICKLKSGVAGQP
jgi:hypothetical protein